MKRNESKYRVAELGCSAWSTCSTIRQARKDAREARCMGVNVCIVNTETDEIVK